jgi:hypothetical protein
MKKKKKTHPEVDFAMAYIDIAQKNHFAAPGIAKKKAKMGHFRRFLAVLGRKMASGIEFCIENGRKTEVGGSNFAK